MTCYASVHFRGRRNAAPVTETERHYRPGDTVSVDSTEPGGMQAEEYVILELPGEPANWSHLLDSVTGNADQILRLRRFYFDLTKLPAAIRDKLQARKSKLATRKTRYEQLSKIAHLTNLARRGNRDYMVSAIDAAFPNVDLSDITNPRKLCQRILDRLADALDTIDDEIAATATPTITVPDAQIVDSGEVDENGDPIMVGSTSYVIDRGETVP